ncbi:MAG: PilW family protein [Gammaproteobacteria bacterium]|nr:PilW family protein [Gammaproteobacteria bacterium]
MTSRNRCSGYSIVELMVALVIGLVLLLGVMAVFVSSRTSFDASETQAHMSDDGRFAMTLFGEDLRMAGTWGPNSFTNMVDNRTRGPGDRLGLLAPMAGDCETAATPALFFTDLDQAVFASNDVNPFIGPTPCISDYVAGTDVLVVRYADPNPVPDNLVAPGVVYVRSETGNSILFVGPADPNDVPTIPPNGSNHVLRMHIYYVADFTEVAGDGIPSLHRVSLEAGPTLVDEMIVSGVENFQVQLGYDTAQPEPDGEVNSYVNADSLIIDWTDTVDMARVRGARLWLMLRSGRPQKTAPTPPTYSMGGADFTPAAIGNPVIGEFKRLLISGVYDLRNFPLQAPR